MGGDVPTPKEPVEGTAAVDAHQVRDPIEVFRAAIVERARWQELFREAKLTGGEIARLLRAMAAARGLEGYWASKDQRALELLLAGRPDWYKGLLKDPANIPEGLRTALERRATVHR